MKKQILITNGHLQVGGVEKSLINLLSAIDYSKYDVDLLLFEGKGEYLSEVPKEVNIISCDLTQTYDSFFRVLKNNFFNFKIVYRKIVTTLANKFDRKYLKYLIRTKEYDIALAYRVNMPMDYVSYGVKAERKFFWWHHGEFRYPEYLIKRWQNSAQNMDGMVCVSNSVKNIVEQYFESYVKKTYIIPNIISVQELTTENIKKQQNNNIYTIVSVGRFYEEKHMRDCVLAAKELIKKGYNNFKWYLLGDGAEKEYVSNKIVSDGLQNVVCCLGSITNPYTYMKEADLIVHPSYVESFGMTVLEAMALKKLVVAVGSDGIKEYAVDHENALIAQKNINSLVNKIEEAFNINEDEKKRICEVAEKTASKYYPDVIMKQIEKDLFAD